MFSSSQSKKNKIDLSDYDFKRDIDNRLLMADLTALEVEVLKEILYNSLTIPIKELSSSFDLQADELRPVLDKLGSTGLFQQTESELAVNKEMRRYFESQIVKFEEDFQPDMEFLQGLLSAVPIHVLPNWYSISKSTDDIFGSIIEKYLHTPKTYFRYLQELEFEEEALKKIYDAVFSSENFEVPANSLMEKLSIGREKFEELMLFLEYNLTLFLIYRFIDDSWQPYIVPIHEWQCYLKKLKETECVPISDPENIKRRHIHDFGFIEDMAKVLKGDPLAGEKDSPFAKLHEEELQKVLEMTRFDQEWLVNSIQERAMTLYLHSINQYRQRSEYHDRDVRTVEKSIRRVLTKGWVYFDDFMKSIVRSFGKAGPVILKKQGKRWRYDLPEYSETDAAFAKEVIFGHLFRSGMVATGMHNGRPCFIVTPFGRMSLGE